MYEVTLTKKQEDDILKEIGYTRAQLRMDVATLRLWLQEEKHLPPSRLKEGDIFLSNFLVGCKGSLETAKRKLDHYYSLRGKGELFTDRDNLEYLSNVIKHTALTDLPLTTPDNCTITICRLLDDNVDLFNGVESMKCALLLLECCLRMGSGISAPVYYLMDGSRFNLPYFLKFHPVAIRSFLSFIQEAYPIRIRKIIMANVPNVLATLFNSAVMPLLKDKNKKKFYITSEPLEKVFEFPELLPCDYEGGRQPSLQAIMDQKLPLVTQVMKDALPQLQEEVDESRRPQLENGTRDPHFGLHGSIKSLVSD